jgi:hypothetical protein
MVADLSPYTDVGHSAALIRDFETAWQELGVYLERGGGADENDEQVAVLMERLRMFLEFDVTQRPDGGSFDSAFQITDQDE